VRGVNLPSIDALIKLPEVFDMTLDYLAFKNKGGIDKQYIQDRKLLRRYENISNPILSFKRWKLEKFIHG